MYFLKICVVFQRLGGCPAPQMEIKRKVAFPKWKFLRKTSGGILNLDNIHLRLSSIFNDIKLNKKHFRMKLAENLQRDFKPQWLSFETFFFIYRHKTESKTFSNETCGKHSGEESLWQGFTPTGNFFCRDLNQRFVVFHNCKRSVEHKYTILSVPPLCYSWKSQKKPSFSSISNSLSIKAFSDLSIILEFLRVQKPMIFYQRRSFYTNAERADSASLGSQFDMEQQKKQWQ